MSTKERMRNTFFVAGFTLLCAGGILFATRETVDKDASYDTRNQAAELLDTEGCETRAVWLNDYAFDTEAHRSETLKKIQEANLNTAFLIAPEINGNNGWSEAADFSAMLTDLKSANIVVHIWIASACRVSNACNEVDFRNSTERQTQVDWAAALLDQYPSADGIHLDYIRYIDKETIQADKMNGVSLTVEETYNELDTNYPAKRLSAATLGLSGEYADFENEDVPSWYRTWFNDHISDPINRWTAPGYNGSGVPSGLTRQQDPYTWMTGGYIDDVFSMEYDYSTSWWSGEVDIWNSFLNNDLERLNMGLGWYSGVWSDPEIEPTDVAAEIVNKINYGRSNNVRGYSIFEFGEPGNDDSILITQLSGGPFSSAADSCVSQLSECTDDDWELSVSPCQPDNTYTRTWTKVGDCTGGVTHPPTETLSCQYSPPRELFQCTDDNWSHSDSECVDGMATRTWTKMGECEGGVGHPATEEIECNVDSGESDETDESVTGENDESESDGSDDADEIIGTVETEDEDISTDGAAESDEKPDDSTGFELNSYILPIALVLVLIVIVLWMFVFGRKRSSNEG